MSAKANAKGILAHKFHGTYWCIIALEFESADHAKSSLPKLGNGWKPSDNHDTVLRFVGNSEELDKCKEVLGSFGADTSKIDSIAKSVDHGEWFKVEIPLDMADPNQLSLPIG